MRTIIRLCLIGLLAVVGIVGQRQSASAQTPPRIEFQITRAGLIVGVAGGSGTLFYDRRQIPLGIGGVSLGATIGVSRAEFIGNVYNLRSAADIAGVYTAVEAGVSVAGGRNVARLRNSRGVILEVRGRQVGFMFSIDLSGLNVRLR
jgi:hypothetical protein